MAPRRRTLIGVLVIAGAVVGGCGGDDADGGGAGGGDDGLSTGPGGDGSGDGGTVTVVAEDSLSFDQDEYTASAGEVTFEYENGGNMAHTLLIEGVDDFVLRVTSNGDADEGGAELEPGEYRLYCDIPGHEAMEATLTIE